MKKSPIISCLFLFCSIFIIPPCIAQDFKLMLEFNDNNRILTLAPEPANKDSAPVNATAPKTPDIKI